MINHSCEPNAEVAYPFNSHRCVVNALRALEPGEQILISYLNPAEMERSRHSRRKTLRENYMFDCRYVPNRAGKSLLNVVEPLSLSFLLTNSSSIIIAASTRASKQEPIDPSHNKKVQDCDNCSSCVHVENINLRMSWVYACFLLFSRCSKCESQVGDPDETSEEEMEDEEEEGDDEEED